MKFSSKDISFKFGALVWRKFEEKEEPVREGIAEDCVNVKGEEANEIEAANKQHRLEDGGAIQMIFITF